MSRLNSINRYIMKKAINKKSDGGGGSSITVVDNLNSDSSTDALSAKQGKVLDGKIPVVVDNLTSDSSTSALSAKQGNQLKVAIDEVEQKCKVKKELLEITDLTFIYNNGYYTSDESTGIHNGYAYKKLTNENAILSIKFKGFYTKDSQGNYSKIWNNSDMPQIKENGALPENGYLWRETDVNFVENPYGFSGVGKPEYNNLTYPYTESPSGYIATTYREVEYNNNKHLYVELVLLTQNQGVGTTEQQVRDLYNWTSGAIGLFELTYI